MAEAGWAQPTRRQCGLVALTFASLELDDGLWLLAVDSITRTAGAVPTRSGNERSHDRTNRRWWRSCGGEGQEMLRFCYSGAATRTPENQRFPRSLPDGSCLQRQRATRVASGHHPRVAAMGTEVGIVADHRDAERARELRRPPRLTRGHHSPGMISILACARPRLAEAPRRGPINRRVRRRRHARGRSRHPQRTGEVDADREGELTEGSTSAWGRHLFYTDTIQQATVVPVEGVLG